MTTTPIVRRSYLVFRRRRSDSRRLMAAHQWTEGSSRVSRVITVFKVRCWPWNPICRPPIGERLSVDRQRRPPSVAGRVRRRVCFRLLTRWYRCHPRRRQGTTEHSERSWRTAAHWDRAKKHRHPRWLNENLPSAAKGPPWTFSRCHASRVTRGTMPTVSCLFQFSVSVMFDWEVSEGNQWKNLWRVSVDVYWLSGILSFSFFSLDLRLRFCLWRAPCLLSGIYCICHSEDTERVTDWMYMIYIRCNAVRSGY